MHSTKISCLLTGLACLPASTGTNDVAISMVRLTACVPVPPLGSRHATLCHKCGAGPEHVLRASHSDPFTGSLMQARYVWSSPVKPAPSSSQPTPFSSLPKPWSHKLAATGYSGGGNGSGSGRTNNGSKLAIKPPVWMRGGKEKRGQDAGRTQPTWTPQVTATWF